MIVSQWEKARTQKGVGVGGLVSHDSSVQQMSTSNGANVSSPRLQYETDLVAKVTSCVDGFTSVLITTQQ